MRNLNRVLTMFIPIFLAVGASSVAKAETDSLIEVGNGACLLSNSKETLRMISFNDQWAKSITIEQLNDQVSNLIASKNYLNNELSISSVSFGFHCGGYGASVIGKVETNLGEFCLWVKPNGKNLEVRSFGVLSVKEKLSGSDFCNGSKWGEFILGTTDESVIFNLRSSEWGKYISEINLIATGTYKVVLKSEFNLHEEEVKNLILSKFRKDQIKYIEFNEYQHSVGEFVSLK